MEILIILLILLGLPFIIYISIKTLQLIGENANLKSKSGILITIIIVFACLYLIYISKGIFVGFLIVIFLPFILVALGSSKSAVSSGGENVSPSTTQSIKSIIPAPILVLSYGLLIFACFWMFKVSDEINIKILCILLIIGSLISGTQLIKKQRSV